MKKTVIATILFSMLFFCGCFNAAERRKLAEKNHIVLSKDTLTVISVSQMDLIECEIPAGITAIGKSAFRDCRKLAHVAIPAGVVSIGERAFAGCINLKYLELPDSVEKIDTAAFVLSSLEEIKLSRNLKEIGASAFLACRNLKSLTLPSGLRIIRSSAFEWCPALNTVVPASVELIEESAFTDAASVKVDPANPRYFTDAHGALFDRKEKKLLYLPPGFTGSYTVPPGTRVIGKYAFEKCSRLTAIILPEGLETIREGAFGKCSGLKSVTLPESVKNVEDYAFHDSPCEKDLKTAYPELFKRYTSGNR